MASTSRERAPREKTPGEVAREQRLIHLNADGVVSQPQAVQVEISSPGAVLVQFAANGRSMTVTVGAVTVLKIINAVPADLRLSDVRT